MAALADRLVVVGVSHRTAPVQVRERLALDDAGVQQELTRLRERGLAREAMIVATCNRVELYAVLPDGDAGPIRAHLAARAGERVDDHLFEHHDVEAARHLMRVACALDSLVVGEPQILGQVKEAVRQAEEAHALGPVLHRLTQVVLHTAKHVRTHTDIGRHNVGIGNAGVWLAQQIFSTLKGRRALLVGTGEMGRQVATAMVAAGLSELVVTNRTFARAVEMAEAHAGTPIPFERMPEYLARVDVVITATGSATPVVTAPMVRAALQARRWQPLFLVDLSVPRNVDPEVDKLDQAYLFNVDDLTVVMERGKEKRAAAASDAEAIVAREAERFATRLAVLEVHDVLATIAGRAERMRQTELQRSHRVLDGLSAEQREGVDVMTRALVKRLLHHTLQGVRDAAARGDAPAVEQLAGPWREGDER